MVDTYACDNTRRSSVASGASKDVQNIPETHSKVGEAGPLPFRVGLQLKGVEPEHRGGKAKALR